MNNKTKTQIICIISLSLLALAVLTPSATAAGTINLSENANVSADSTITVTGTGFEATQIVGIAFGSEVPVTDEEHTTFSGTDTGPYTAILDNIPVKPGSFSMHWDTEGTGSDWTDNGDGTLTSSSSYSTGGTVNYVTGEFGRSSSMDLSTYTLTATCAYTSYQYDVTPTAGVTTTGSGDFTADITVPTVANGVYTVTAIDASGNIATASIGVGVDVPETFTFGVVALLSVAAVAGSAFLLRKPKTTSIIGKL